MKRTLEGLSHRRQEKEKELSDKLARLQELSQALEGIHSTLETLPSLTQGEGSVRDDSPRPNIDTELAPALQQLHAAMQRQLELSREAMAAQIDLARTQNELMEAYDKEWDALGSNHVGMIFKSMEWRIDKLKAGCDDAALLMKNYVQLREQLQRLLAALEGKDLPTPAQVRSISAPLEDIVYAGFENRHRGSEQDVKKQQEIYLPYFQTERTVLDLGCGRGEFLDLLSQNNIPAEGMDINEQMIAICRERGLNCRTGDILESLASYADGSLGGVFSSQVVELAESGCLVLETLNPASVFTLVHVYFLDITHQQPVHPRALEFLLESAGFQDVEIRYSSPLDEEALQALPPESEAAAVLNRNLDKLNQLLFSPVNYAAIGRKVG
jgi:O-antigen chain-terminating methyltransferase